MRYRIQFSEIPNNGTARMINSPTLGEAARIANPTIKSSHRKRGR
jgi:hypothetical protein